MIKIIHILYCCIVIICMYIIYRQNMLILVTQCLHKDMICSVVFILAVKIKEQIQYNIALTFIFLILTENESENLFIHSLFNSSTLFFFRLACCQFYMAFSVLLWICRNSLYSLYKIFFGCTYSN